MNTVRNPHVYAEQVKQLYAIESVGLVGTMVNSAIPCFVQRNVISHQILLSWFAILSGVTLLRFLLLRGYQRVPVEESQAGTWGALFIAGAACSGVLWGSAAIWMFPEDSTTHQVFLPLILGGMVAGTAAVYSAVMGAFLAYSLPALVPIAVRFLAGLRGIVLDITERRTTCPLWRRAARCGSRSRTAAAASRRNIFQRYSIRNSPPNRPAPA